MTPLQLYHQLLQNEQFQADPRQQQAMMHLQRLYDELLAHSSAASTTGWKSLLGKILQQPSPVLRGVYLWGGVGIGKTWLMDTFFQAFDATKKLRMHFHRFMRQIHRELTCLQGQADPLKIVAKKIAQEAQVVCLDEFLVHDIADAMLLANLLKALFAEGITLVATANVAPDDLYRRGAQRENFLPAIELIKKNMEVVHLQTALDYRMRDLEQVKAYYAPLNAETDLAMYNVFQQLSHQKHVNQVPLSVEGRLINTLGLAEGIAWFDFQALCSVPRSQLDYLEIANCFHTVLLSNVPQIDMHQDNLARYLISLVDVFYDTRVKLIVSAAVSLEDLYPEGRLSFEFKRTRSRLFEMQSREYLTRPHLGE